MKKKQKKKTNDFEFTMVKTVIPKITVKEQSYSIDTVKNPSDTVRYDFNLIEYPIFTKSDRIREHVALSYYFDSARTENLIITPNIEIDKKNKKYAQNKVLQDFDEKIFLGLLKMYETTGNRKIITTYAELIKTSNLKYNSPTLNRTKDSLCRLNGCKLQFNNVFYNAKKKAKCSKQLRILDTLHSIEFSDLESGKVENDVQERSLQIFNGDAKINEVIILTINEDIISNLQYKGYKYFKHQELLGIKNSISRKLYMLLTKWYYWEKQKNMKSVSITRSSNFLSSRIPLSWDKKNIHGSVGILKRSLEQLKKLGKIKNFKFDPRGKLKDSVFTIYFNTKNQIKENSYVGVQTTHQEHLQIKSVEENKLIDAHVEIVEEKTIDESLPNEVFCYLRDDVIDDPQVIALLKKYYQINGMEYVIDNVIYTNKKSNKHEGYAGYLSQSLENNWGLGCYKRFKKAEERKTKKAEEKKKSSVQTTDVEDKKAEEEKLKLELFNKLSQEEQDMLITQFKKQNTCYSFLSEERIKSIAISMMEVT